MALQFYDSSQNILPDLFDKKAEEIAKGLVVIMSGKSIGVKRNQLRRIYDEVKRLQRLLEIVSEKKWNDVYPLIKMIKSKVSYQIARAVSREKGLKIYYQKLLDFIKDGIDQIKNEEDFKCFCLLFEAVYGYYYQLGGSETEK